MTSIDRSIVSEYVNKLAVNNNISDKVKDKVVDSIANDGVI